ncbi:MAG: glutamine-hydrolyzing carbamoyl-phosphate synthase small subunit [Patescibacteria group bacterium]
MATPTKRRIKGGTANRTDGHPAGDGFFEPAELRLRDSSRYPGRAAGLTGPRDARYGDVVFATGMTGYVESLTDPSYAGQILVFTYPLIGNYGVPGPETWESKRVHARAVVVAEAVGPYSHHAAARSLVDWLRGQDVPVIEGVDTRALTRRLREHGTMLGAVAGHEAGRPRYWDPYRTHLVSGVSVAEPADLEPEGSSGTRARGKTVVLLDCGAKENIARELRSLGIRVRRVPYDHDFTGDPYDGVVLSNGPGDPTMVPETLPIIRKALRRRKPLLGICLGVQLLALAVGAKTYRLPYGHRGQNQPVRDMRTGRCYVTSQNHGFAIDERTLPRNWEVSFKNLNDGSVEGIRHRTLPFQAVQFHPEASPGPTDTAELFRDFAEAL